MVGDKSCQAFVSSQDVEEEAGHLGNSPFCYLAMDPLPLYLSTR